MILIFELVCIATGHAATNSAVIQTMAQAFPVQSLKVFAHISHVTELQGDIALVRYSNVSFKAVVVSQRFRFRPHIVSFRRALREIWTILSGLWLTPADEPVLIMLISATPTAIFAASLLARLARRRIRVQAGLHGNLNNAFGWRTRNPFARMVDLHAAVTSGHGGRVRFLLLEEPIRRALIRLAPITAKTTDVLPHPISPFEVHCAEVNQLTVPLRIGMVGQATEAKGITPFLAMARDFRQTMPDSVSFHLVGNVPMGAEMAVFEVLNEPVPTLHISRAQFLEKLRRLHYVCLLLQPDYYALSASGALMDAVIWLRPIIATRVPIVTELFDRFGDIGELHDDVEGVRAAIARLACSPDPERYDRQIVNLRRARTSRLPACLAVEYRRIIEAGFPELLSGRRFAGAAAVS